MLRRLATLFVGRNKSMCRFVNQRWPGFALYAKGASHPEVLVRRIARAISQRTDAPRVKVLEIGGGDQPLWHRAENVQYDGLDIRWSDSWARVYDSFHTQSIEGPIAGSYDLIISLAVLEHVRDNGLAVASMYRSLAEGGTMIHYLPSRFHPYSLALRLVGPGWQKKLISLLRPWAQETTGYPTHFDHCSPNEMRALLARTGFREIKTTPFYRASDYFCFFFPFFVLVTLWDNLCRRLDWKQMCHGFILEARK